MLFIHEFSWNWIKKKLYKRPNGWIDSLASVHINVSCQILGPIHCCKNDCVFSRLPFYNTNATQFSTFIFYFLLLYSLLLCLSIASAFLNENKIQMEKSAEIKHRKLLLQNVLYGERTYHTILMVLLHVKKYLKRNGVSIR